MNNISTIQEMIINMHDVSTKETGSVSVESDSSPLLRGSHSNGGIDGMCPQGTLPATKFEGSGSGCTTSNMGVGTPPGEHVPPAEVKLTSGERAQGLIRGLCFVFQHHRITREAMDSFKTQATAYLDVPSEAVFFKRAKYLTVAPMALYLGQESPKEPDLAWKPIGQYRNWAKTRLRVFCYRNTCLWYSILQAKRAAAPLSIDLVLTTYKEHREAMEIKDPIDNETHDSVMKELRPVLEKIRRKLQQVYQTAGREQEGLAPRETRHAASTRACWEESRAGGGQLGAIMRFLPELHECNPLNPVRSGRRDPDLISMTFYPRVVISGVVQLNVVLETYGYPNGEKQWYDSVRESFMTFAQKGTSLRLKATIQAVLEPLKVRVISKGNAVPYYGSKVLQKKLHDVMRDMDCFRLIGATLCPTDLIDLAQNPVQCGTGRLEWFSIDYSAATDRLSARLSASILNFLIEGQDPAMQIVWRAVLAPHECRYPFPYSEQVKPVVQRNGQLMGSILSFPILCLANLGLYLENVKEDRRSLRLKLKGVLVNGDDMLYVAPHSLWRTHVDLGTRVGLSMSPGKAYAHPVYANANSACYHFDLGKPILGRFGSTPRYVPFLNSGLYFGQNKVLGGDDIETEKSYVSVIPKLLQGALPGRASEVMSMYLNRHTREIKEECAGRNLFIPISLGGMGLDCIEGFKFHISGAQRMLAKKKLEDLPFGVISQLPLERHHLEGKIPEAPQPLSAPWLSVSLTTPDLHPGEVRDTRLDTANWLRRASARAGRSDDQMLGNRLLFFPLRVSPIRRPGATYVHKPPRFNDFACRTELDWMLADAEDHLEVVA